MKNRNGFFCMLIVLMFVCNALPAWASTAYVTSTLSAQDGKVFIKVTTFGPGCYFHGSDNFALEPGATASCSNTDWKDNTGSWQDVLVKPDKQWEGCPVPDWTSYPISRRYSNTNITLKRSGCNIDAQIQ
jgi:hypothetical protein